MRLLRLLWVFARISAMNEMAYRANFWIQAAESVLSLATTLGTVYIVFQQTDVLGGWEVDELLALIGVYYLVLGAINLVISPSLSRFMEDVRQGTLDYTLTKPVDAQFLVSFSEFHMWKLLDVVLGVAVLATALVRLSRAVSLAHAGTFLFALVVGLTIVYSFWLVLASCTFWFIRVENILMIFWSVYVAGRWPIGIYPPWLRWILTAVVPVAFAVTVPAQAIAGRLSATMLAAGVALALVLLLVSRWLWNLGLEHYSGASA